MTNFQRIKKFSIVSLSIITALFSNAMSAVLGPLYEMGSGEMSWVEAGADGTIHVVYSGKHRSGPSVDNMGNEAGADNTFAVIGDDHALNLLLQYLIEQRDHASQFPAVQILADFPVCADNLLLSGHDPCLDGCRPVSGYKHTRSAAAPLLKHSHQPPTVGISAAHRDKVGCDTKPTDVLDNICRPAESIGR